MERGLVDQLKAPKVHIRKVSDHVIEVCLVVNGIVEQPKPDNIIDLSKNPDGEVFELYL